MSNWLSSYYPNVDVFTIIQNALGMLLFIVVVASVIYLSLAGLKYIMSQGDVTKAKEAQAAIVNVIIGLVLAFSAYFVVMFVLQRLGVDIGVFGGTPTPTPVPANARLIAYIQNGSVYVAETDGKNVRKVTTDTSTTVRYLDVTWKTSQELTYLRCENSCSVITKNLSVNSDKAEFNLTNTSFGRISWSPDGKFLAFLRTDADGKIQAGLKKQGETAKVLKEFGTVANAKLTLDDSFGLSFSPNSRYLLVNETLTSNQTGFNSITMFDAAGNFFDSTPRKISELPLPAKSGTFISNNTFLYSENQVLKQKNIENNSQKDINSSFIGREIHSVSDTGKAIYWEFEGSTHPVIYTVNLDGTTTIRGTTLHTPIMMDDHTAFALATDMQLPINDYPLPNLGISRINLDDGVVTQIVTSKVERFAVSPAK